ncbi:hypothetical protein SEA_CBORCH11_86 [Mycobacterium phage Cborch11]|nr:hypothetical protein SEA_CBORCH11_86 [Mycobacterium phage Cborch11]
MKILSAIRNRLFGTEDKPESLMEGGN